MLAHSLMISDSKKKNNTKNNKKKKTFNFRARICRFDFLLSQVLISRFTML